MSENRTPQKDTSNPMNLDSEQLKELDKLIDNLKKEIVFPGKKATDKSALSQTRKG